MIIVVKVGTSSITDDHGIVSVPAIQRLCGDVARLRRRGDRVVIVSSGAIAAGLPVLGIATGDAGAASPGNSGRGATGSVGGPRAADLATLQAVSAVGQSRLLRVYDDVLSEHGLIGGQVLLAPLDFVHRKQYLHARQTLSRLLELSVIPIVNENDAIADDEIRFGDNDRLAGLVSHLVRADLLVLLTDTAGLLTADPRNGEGASLIEEIVEVDHSLEVVAGGAGTVRGSGGMASKLAAAKMAAWSGVRTVIANAARPGVLLEAADDVPGVGTVVRPRDRRLSARKLWIAFAIGAGGTVVVDDGARTALIDRQTSLLPAGVVAVEGKFDADDAVEIAGTDGRVFAKGLVRHPATRIRRWAGQRSAELPPDLPHEVVHRDDLVMLP